MNYGLVGAGPVADYFATRIPRLKRELGPVAATSYRLASRIVNTLGAGTSMPSVAHLKDTKHILLCAPPPHFPALKQTLLKGKLPWAKRTVLICDCEASSEDLGELTEVGCYVGSLRPIPGSQGRYLLEGHYKAVHLAQYLLIQIPAPWIEIETASYPLYQAAVTLAGSLSTPVMHACQMAVRATGILGNARDEMVEALYLHTLRMFLYSGRRSWNGVAASGDVEQMARERSALEAIDPELARFYDTQVEAATRLLKPTPEPEF